MEYAIQILIPIAMGLVFGNWLTTQFGADPIWTVFLAVVGLFLGMGLLYKRVVVMGLKNKSSRPPTAQTYDDREFDDD